MKHAAIIPLIGGEILASDEVFGVKPEYLLSYTPFEANETHLLNHYNKHGHDIKYVQLDKSAPDFDLSVDVVSSVCPCAGLSQYHSKAGEDNPNNQWMEKTTEYVLSTIKPKVMWGENAPGLAGKIGKFMLDKLRDIGKRNGYHMGLYLTKNLKHGVPQFRKRTFYFFWREDVFSSVPKLNFYTREHAKIEDVISRASTLNFQQELINDKTPSKDDPYYRYILEEIFGGITHRQFFDKVETDNVRGNDVESIIEKLGHDYMQVAKWMEKNGYDREVPKCHRKYEKLKAGGNIMRRGTIVPKDYVGAFVGHNPKMMTHPYEDRYLTFREAMCIMGLPDDFELLNPKDSVNHICQNVPFQTAKDMATEVRESLLGNRELSGTDFLFINNYHDTYEDLNPKTNTIESFFV